VTDRDPRVAEVGLLSDVLNGCLGDDPGNWNRKPRSNRSTVSQARWAPPPRVRAPSTGLASIFFSVPVGGAEVVGPEARNDEGLRCRAQGTLL
jgi:hypothetical protein